MNDGLFVTIEHHIDRWKGEIPWKFPCSCTEIIRFDFLADEKGPTASQRALFLELTNRYESVWPAIAKKIVVLNPEVESLVALPFLLSPRLLLFVPGIIGKEIFDFTVGYEFKEEENLGTGYFVSFVDWNIVSALKAS